MKNVLELIDGGFIGGGQTHILSLVKCLDKNEFNITIAASPAGEFKKRVLAKGLKFADIHLSKIYRAKILNKLDGIIKDYEIDIIHSHGGVAGMYARFYKKKFPEIKVIHTIHGIHYIHSKNFLRRILSHQIERYLAPYADRYICVSDTDLKTAAACKIIIESKTVVIKNGIDLIKFSKREKDESLFGRFHLHKNDFIIGNISRFDEQKNQKFIIANCLEILAKYKHSKIIFIGDGKLINDCKHLADHTGYGDRFVFTGEVNNPEAYYSLFDIFVFPSLWEGLSISLIEAMASANCILASDIPANKELLGENENGWLFSTSDPAGYKEKLNELIADTVTRKLLSTKALAQARHFSEEGMGQKIRNEYLKII